MSSKIDRLIAEHIFGHTVVETRWGEQKQYGCLTIGEPDHYDDAGEMKLHNPLPDYSTDVGAAWQVVEKLPELGLDIEIQQFVRNVVGREVQYRAAVREIGKQENCWLYFDKTAQYAICGAALWAKGVSIGDAS